MMARYLLSMEFIIGMELALNKACVSILNNAQSEIAVIVTHYINVWSSLHIDLHINDIIDNLWYYLIR